MRGGLRLRLFAPLAACGSLALAPAAHAAPGDVPAQILPTASLAPALSTPTRIRARASTQPEGSQPDIRPLISPEYHARIVDTEAKSWVDSTATALVGGATHPAAAATQTAPALEHTSRRSMAHADPRSRTTSLASGGRPRMPASREPPAWYRVSRFQYQFRAAISHRENLLVYLPMQNISSSDRHRTTASTHAVRRVAARVVVRTARRSVLSIASQISSSKRISRVISPMQRHPSDGGPPNGRTLLQLGALLGLAYVLFVVFWFWKTRAGHRFRREVRF